VLEIPKNSGIERLIDFFERDAGGNFHVADFQMVPVEAAIAFLRFVRRAFAIKAADGLWRSQGRLQCNFKTGSKRGVLNVFPARGFPLPEGDVPP
jgi:hypothetical protein